MYRATISSDLRLLSLRYGTTSLDRPSTDLMRCQLSDEAASFELMYSFIAFGRTLDRTHDVVIQRFASWLILERLQSAPCDIQDSQGDS
jgi:hypothetical protein